MNKRLFKIILLAALVVVSSSGAMAAEKPLKVYILAGQSNMQGHAKLSTFDYIGMDPQTAPLLKEMRNADGTPRVCEKVWISYLTGKDGVMGEAVGKLTVGYGARENPAVPDDKIGPEFTFGIYMQKTLNEPILIIKTAWGGKSLFCDFRPPSAGPFQPIEKPSKAGKKQVKEPEGTDPAAVAAAAEQAKKEGLYYRLMIEHVKKVLADPKRVYPDYDEKQGYELAGFVWFQGWNDMCNKSVYPDYDKPGGYDMYSTLLTHFIRDVRKDLSAPAMPFVIGVMGVDGDQAKEGLANIRPAMAAPADLPEFKGNVVAVQTAPFWDHALAPACGKAGRVAGMKDRAYGVNKETGLMEKREPGGPGWDIIGKPELQERVWRFTSFTSQQQNDIFTLPETSKPSRWLKRFRDVTLPAGMENWTLPEFDDSKWQQGKAPIGKGTWKCKWEKRKEKGEFCVKHNSDWGEGEFLLMRTKFELDAVDLPAYRLAVLSRQGFHVYLNGHKITTYEWWQEGAYYRAYPLTANETQYLKKGVNVLAAYANVQCGRNLEDPFNSIDLFLEGITKEGQEALNKEYEKICPAEDMAVASGASNQAYHYMGSAKILGQIGKAFAEALVELDKKSGSKKEGNP